MASSYATRLVESTTFSSRSVTEQQQQKQQQQSPLFLESVRCTRWKELQDTVDHHIQLAARLGAPTVFRLLNGSSGGLLGIGSAVGDDNTGSIYSMEREIQAVRKSLARCEPSGATPLA
jgi:hypothetical protein